MQAAQSSQYARDSDFRGDLACIAMFWLCVLLTSPRRRQQLHARIAGLHTQAEAGEAASIAALIGTRSTKDVLALAHANFKALPFGVLSLEHFASSQDTGLHRHALKSRLGAVDAFISHSWHDPAAPKMEALFAWAAAFQAEHGRLPTVWLDKGCVSMPRLTL